LRVTTTLTSFAADMNASALPQWTFVTPNMVDDGHDTSVDYAAQWLQYWLVSPLTSKTSTTMTHSSSSLSMRTSHIPNTTSSWRCCSDAPFPKVRAAPMTRPTTRIHPCSQLSRQWGLRSLGRGESNKYVSRCFLLPVRSTHVPHRTLSNAFSFVADATGYTNLDLSSLDVLTNATGTMPGR
jgi:hypothetical protein